MTGKIQIVCGGQYGSEGKGNVAGHLAKGRGDVVAVRVAGPNAGHSAVDPSGRKWALRQIPVMAVTNPDAKLVLGAGSEIDETVLATEIRQLEDAGIKICNRLWVDAQATVISQEHIAQEGGYGGALTGRIGSTGKGVGAARAARIWREAPTWGDLEDSEMHYLDIPGSDTAAMMRQALGFDTDVIIEGTQGYGLGLHAGHYPFCTSSDCRFTDFLAMAGLNHFDGEVESWVVLRTYPIRVAGNSGPLPGETSWDNLALITRGYVKPEYTTVTRMQRRVGAWDPDLAATAIAANGGNEAKVALTFFDYWYPELAGVASATPPHLLTGEMWRLVRRTEDEIGSTIDLLGTGPDSFIQLTKGI